MADPRVLLAAAIDDSAEALYRIVADIPDPASTGAGRRFQADPEPSPRWPRTRYVAVRAAGGAYTTTDVHRPGWC